MGKVLKIQDDIVVIGTNGTIKKVKVSDCYEKISVGDKVEIFESDNEIYISPVEEKDKVMESLKDFQSVGRSIDEGLNCDLKKVDKTSYILLSMLLGGFGVHKFYAGKTALGVVYLIFCWTYIPAILGFIEGIVVINKPADKFGKVIV